MTPQNAELIRLANAAADAALAVGDAETAEGPKVKGMLVLARMRLRAAMDDYRTALTEAGR